MNWFQFIGIRPLLLIMVVLAAWGVTAEVAGEGRIPDTTINIIGSGNIYKDNISAGREEAIANCLVSAVSRVVAELISEETIVRHFQLLNDLIFAKPNTFIREYKVLTESAAGRNYRVLVQATIISDQLAGKLSNLGVIVSGKVYPKIVMFIAEQGMFDTYPRMWWGPDADTRASVAASAMADILLRRGYTIADTARLQASSLSSEISDQEAVSAAIDLSADVVVIGRATAGIAANTMGGDVKSYAGNVNAHAIRTDTGERIAMIQKSFTASGSDDTQGNNVSLTEAGNLAGEELAMQIAAKWMISDAKPKFVELTVEGTGGNIAHFVRFRGRLREMPRVNGIQLKEMMPDAAVLMVDYQGSAKALAEELVKEDFGVFGLDIYEINPFSLKVKLTTQ